MEWGSRRQAVSRLDADEMLASAKTSFPEVDSAYVPSGKVPVGGFVALAIGSGLGVPLGGLAALLAGSVTVLLLVLLGLLIALVAACGWVVCITVVLEIAIALVGGGLTFGAAGFVPGWVTAHAGSYGKNRSPMMAALFALPSTVGAFAILALSPQVLTLFVEPGGDDLSVSGLVYLVAGTSWIHLGVWGLGFLIALGAAWLSATSEVASQKFCEPCDQHMDEVPMHGMSFEFATWAFQTVSHGGAEALARELTRTQGLDVEPTAFMCDKCHRGFFEARAHFFAEWQGTKDREETRADWLCFSMPTEPDQSPFLMQCKRIEDA